MEKHEKAALCVLHSIRGIGHRSLMKIKQEFGSYSRFLNHNAAGLTAFLPAYLLEEIAAVRKRIDPISYLDGLAKRGIGVSALDESSYPEALKNIHDPPAVIYCRGRMAALGNFSIAVVGARAATGYGKRIARELGQSLAECNVTVVSGMARGIDKEAHQGALDRNGCTIAVLGSGIDVVYPRENHKLYEQICSDGLVISEFPPGSNPDPAHFPMRNRLISGLSRGVVVVEARIKSGALITADFALEQGKDVFAVPGPINSPASAGTNKLIKQGAILTTGIIDIIQEYYDLEAQLHSFEPKQEELLLLDKEESVIIESMSSEPCHFDRLLNKTGYAIGQLSSLLLNLELRGIVQSLPGNYYVKL
ncbi:rossmann fold nucleotide-binding protein smf [hydrocarbon metagenome]|uniref:Rossmann fold nucleotide-binding protein smf n=1 Tax=hydrocarbon metagenome TaxID=938273 RepID=A0A0W8E4K6_9ZZZZ